MPPKNSTRVPNNLSRRLNSEKIVTRNLLNGFVAKGSRGESLLEEIIQCPIKRISLSGLIHVGYIVSKLINVKLERNYKRKKALIVKWFQDNEELIEPIKSSVKIVYETDNSNINQKLEEEEGNEFSLLDN